MLFAIETRNTARRTQSALVFVIFSLFWLPVDVERLEDYRNNFKLHVLGLGSLIKSFHFIGSERLC